MYARTKEPRHTSHYSKPRTNNTSHLCMHAYAQKIASTASRNKKKKKSHRLPNEKSSPRVILTHDSAYSHARASRYTAPKTACLRKINRAASADSGPRALKGHSPRIIYVRASELRNDNGRSGRKRVQVHCRMHAHASSCELD